MSSSIHILFIGDIVGNVGMDAVAAFLPTFSKKYGIDFIIANGENAMDGKSISEAQLKRLFELGVHVVTSGNHIWDRWHIQKLLSEEPRLLRPANYPRDNAGRGYAIVEAGGKGPVGVLNLQGRTFMSPIDCPFKTADWAVSKIAEETPVIILDMHAEATAEKLAMGWHLDGRVSAVIGTHTHVQTADARILPQGTAYISDVGMTGPYDSVLGMRKEVALRRFIRQTPNKFEVAESDVHFSAIFLDVNSQTGKALHIESIFFPEMQRHVDENH
jgi:2',3'-cyclic-nucleotide 2'-phosphodiesterase